MVVNHEKIFELPYYYICFISDRVAFFSLFFHELIYFHSIYFQPLNFFLPKNIDLGRIIQTLHGGLRTSYSHNFILKFGRCKYQIWQGFIRIAHSFTKHFSQDVNFSGTHFEYRKSGIALNP